MGFHRFALGLRHWNCLCSALVMAWGSSNSCCHQCHQRDWPLDFWPALSHGHLDIIVDGKDLKRHLLFCPPPSSLRRLVRLRVSKQKIIHVHKHGLYRGQFLHIETFTGEEETFTQRRFCTEKPLNRAVLTRRRLYTEKLLHRNFCTGACAQSRFCTKRVWHNNLSHKNNFYTEDFGQSSFSTEQALHTEAITQMLLHTEACTHKSFNTEKLCLSEALPHWKTAILPHVRHFAQKGCVGRCKIAILDKLLTFGPHFCERTAPKTQNTLGHPTRTIRAEGCSGIGQLAFNCTFGRPTCTPQRVARRQTTFAFHHRCSPRRVTFRWTQPGCPWRHKSEIEKLEM